VLDEFAFHLDARKVYEAIEPSITRGYSLEIISTPNGQQGEYHKLAKAAGLVDDDAQRAAVEEETQAILDKDKKRLASLTYLTYPESRSPDRTKKVEVTLTPKELADLEAASRRLAKSPQDIFRRGAALYIQTNRAKRKR
jgi:phage FluMu gp28-like protein